MVQGTSSWAGKSLLATALCRHFARRGVRVAPFKGQNMSNNARVTDGGGEIGVAQFLQARAAGVAPDVRMNPVLVKPEGPARSQVVVRGAVDRELSRRAWRERPAALWPVIAASLRELLADFELVVCEGAGSPAEVNLTDTDLANMRVAREADANVLLVADIHRGGAFAHLYGTWALLGRDRACVRGFVLNGLRGDAALLAPGPERLRALTGVPTVGVVPRLEHGLPDKDGAADPVAAIAPGAADGRPRVAVVRYPTASNLDEFKALEQGARVVWARTEADLRDAALVVLPGAKHVVADLGWLHARGLDAAIRARVAAGGRVLAVCGGLQMLGAVLRDPDGVDGGDADGLGLLPVATTFAPGKTVRRTAARFAALPEPWAALSGRSAVGYEIRHGRTEATGPVLAALPGGLGWAAGPVLGVYLHGLLEDPGLTGALLGVAASRGLDDVLDALADDVGAHLDLGAVEAMAGIR
jgi:adenosylcobyric acid synthase